MPVHARPLIEVRRAVVMIDAPKLSRRLNATIILACETWQRTGSFKFRAAYHTASSVPHDFLLTASSGNFGQALACACRMLQKRCLVVMPKQSAQVKIQSVLDYGGEVDLIDTARVSRAQRLQALASQHPDAYVASAYDDPLVIAGNATLGTELAVHADDFDVVLAPIGGGGLVSGLVQGLRASSKSTPVCAVEPVLANDAAQSLRAGRLMALASEPDTLADGVRTLSLGHHNWEIIRHSVSQVIEVSEPNIASAVRWLFLDANVKAEPTGALALAGLLEKPEMFRGRRVCCVVSGGNVDPALYARLLRES